MSANKTIATLYNPGEKKKDVLISEFVIRLKEFNSIFNDIKTSKMKKPEQHYLLIGQRGSGKSTLIQRLRYAIEDDVQLNKWLIPIAFTEEQYNITELGNLWERIAEHLEDYHQMPGIVTALAIQLDKKDAEQKQLEVLLKFLRENGKKLVLFIDNIGDMLGKFEELEVKRLREVLQTVPDIRLIAASPVMLSEVTDYQKALFEFFKNVRLGGLNKGEMENLLRKLGETHNSTAEIEKIIKEAPERIEILRRLTGGIARTVVMMYNVFIENAEGNPMNDLMQILDEATPLYKHKMDDLPKQQQKIVDAVAKKWEAINTAELSEKLRMPSKLVSAHLRELEKNQWIEKIDTGTKNKLYQIQERFFNIWYLMRYGRRFEKSRVIWLVKFMEELLDKEEIENRMLTLINRNYDGLLPVEEFRFWREVYLETSTPSPMTKFLLLLLDNDPKQIYHKPETPEINWTKNQFEQAILEMFCCPHKLTNADWNQIFSSTQIDEIAEDWQSMLVSALLKTKISDDALLFWKNKFLELIADEKNGFNSFMLYIISIQTNEEERQYFDNALSHGNLYAIAGKLNNWVLSKNDMIKSFAEIDMSYHNFELYKFWEAFIELLNNNPLKVSDIIGDLSDKVWGQGVTFCIWFYNFDRFIALLISKNQYQIALHLLTDEKYPFRDSYRAIYFALMHYMKDEYPNEYLRMPPEMKETVEDVIKKVEEYKVKFA